MRFRKRIKICKGLSLNISGSGISASMGIRGASVTIGKRGIYANYGIPGLGLYQREKIYGDRDTHQTSYSGLSSSSHSKVIINFSMNLDENNNPIVTDQNGVLITDEVLLKIIKRTPQYKEGVQLLSERVLSRIAEKDANFIEIYKQTECPVMESAVLSVLNKIKPDVYEKNIFEVEEPTLSDVKIQLEHEAENNISSIIFWTTKKKREQYVSSRLQQRFDDAHEKWEKEKALFDNNEEIFKKEFDEFRKKKCEEKKSELKRIIEGDNDYVEQKIHSIISQLELPVEFSLDYEYHPEESALFVDLDLPEIEDVPNEIAKSLKSGKVSVRTKSQKQTAIDYATCVCGLAFFFSGMLFNVSTKIKWIKISGYTQRLNNKTNSINDDYVFSVKFDREGFSCIDFENISPIEYITHFPHLINITASYIMKTINPQDELKTIDI